MYDESWNRTSGRSVIDNSWSVSHRQIKGC